MKRLLLTFLALGGCNCELGDPPPTTDSPPPPGCGRLAIPTCWDECCTVSESPDIDPVSCEATCRAGTFPFFDACEPQPWCSDGSVPPGPCGGPDAGPPPLCLGGECCDAMSTATLDPVTCAYECPGGFSFECAPDPVSCSDALRVCAEPSECVVTPNTCCGECGEATLEGSTAVHTERASELSELLCADLEVCDACEGSPNASIVATCNAARCAAVEISRLPLAACTTDEDCVLRTRDCCECGGDTSIESLIALRPDGLIDYLGLVCDTGAICDDCEPTYPEEWRAGCVSGVCQVIVAADSAG